MFTRLTVDVREGYQQVAEVLNEGDRALVDILHDTKQLDFIFVTLVHLRSSVESGGGHAPDGAKPPRGRTT